MSLVPAVSGKSRRQIAAEAKAFLVRHCPNHLTIPGRFPVVELLDLLWSEYELDTGVAELSPGVEGMTWPDGRVLISEATYEKALAGDGRARFTIPHECYHGLAHRSQLADVLIHHGRLVLHRRGDIPAYCDPEWQANTFASFLLMPTAAMKTVIANTERHALLRTVMNEFGVSRTAAEIRLHLMGVT